MLGGVLLLLWAPWEGPELAVFGHLSDVGSLQALARVDLSSRSPLGVSHGAFPGTPGGAPLCGLASVPTRPVPSQFFLISNGLHLRERSRGLEGMDFPLLK